MNGREAILKVHTKKVPLGDDVDLSVLGRGTPGLAGADLANLVNEAALNAARQNRKLVMMIDFELAKDKILMGAERKSMILSDSEKRTTAYHEAGHAVVAVVIPNADPLHKVSIIPRGMALGVTMQLPIDDKHNYSKVYCEDQLAIMMGGRIAEEIYLNQMTTGAGNDIERATEMARKMVCEWGMSELGPLSFGKKEEQIFLGREISQHRDYSEETAIRIDEEVKRIISTAYSRARAIIEQHSNAMVRVAEALLEREVLDGAEVKTLIDGGNLPPMSPTGQAEGYGGSHAAGDSSRNRRTPSAGSRRRGAARAGLIPGFRVYLFDLDGTLLDSAADICGAVQQVLSGHVSEPLPFDYLKSFVGFHLDAVFTDVLPHSTREQLDGLIRGLQDDLPGARARSHAALSRSRRGAGKSRRAQGYRDHQRHAHHARRARTVRPAAVTSIMCRAPTAFPASPRRTCCCGRSRPSGRRPEDCLFVGDSEADMEAGRRAGVRICAVDYGYGKAEALAKWEPDYLGFGFA